MLDIQDPRRRSWNPGAIEVLATRLRRAGQRVTPQRLAILGALEQGHHRSADEILAEVVTHMPAVTRSTVYRTLESFRDAGIVSETDLGHGVRMFEILGEDRHHHLICQGCGAMTELDDSVVQPLRDAIAGQYGFVAPIDHLALFGRCADCAQETT